MFNLNNKVVFITGGSAGIGARVIECLLKENVQHVTNLDIAEGEGTALQNKLNQKYGDNKVKFIQGDVTNEADLNKAYESILQTHGHVDVVINNAGILNDSMEKYKKAIEINVTALTTNTLKAINLMGKDKGGKGGVVLNVSSVLALSQDHAYPIYNATKSAVLQFSNCIGASEHFSKTGVSVIAICFGITGTALISKEKLGKFYEEIDEQYMNALSTFNIQKPESAALSVVEAIKQGESGSTWLSTEDKPAQDITAMVKKAYSILSEVFI